MRKGKINMYIITMIDGTTLEVSASEIEDFIKENGSNIRGIDKKEK